MNITNYFVTLRGIVAHGQPGNYAYIGIVSWSQSRPQDCIAEVGHIYQRESLVGAFAYDVRTRKEARFFSEDEALGEYGVSLSDHNHQFRVADGVQMISDGVYLQAHPEMPRITNYEL